MPLLIEDRLILDYADDIVHQLKIDVRQEETLLHALLQEAAVFLVAALLQFFKLLERLGVAVEILEKLHRDFVEFLHRNLQHEDKHVHRVGLGLQLSLEAVVVHAVLQFQHLGEQLHLVGVDLVERALGDGKRGGNIVHLHLTDAALVKQAQGCQANLLL